MEGAYGGAGVTAQASCRCRMIDTRAPSLKWWYVATGTVGYRTRKPCLGLTGRCMDTLRQNDFGVFLCHIAPWFTERQGEEGVVHGTLQ